MAEGHSTAVQDLFDRAVDLPAEERRALLDAACRDDPGLRAEVEGLLAYAPPPGIEDVTEGIFQSPVARQRPEPATLPGLLTGQDPAPRIGHYRLLRLLGEGGMGRVYEAEQDSPRRTVALKTIRPGLVTPALVKRFRQEARILSRLRHPGIAQVYEAGVADDGQLFFAMEFVRGVPLDEHARRRRLDVHARLTLFAAVCDAVQHTHERGIIHRDLKPSNILVDEAGQPRVLDFGVAHVTNADVRTTTGRTEAGQLLGTVSYMSPEQVTADPAALDRRSDVYALGVILFELLADRLPYEVNRLPLPEVARVIRDQEPPLLGTIDRRHHGAVETIVSKALAKDRARRYDSAGELASDVRRYLAHEPIRARRAGAAERLAYWARRNPGLAASLAAVALLLVSITAASVGVALYFGKQESVQRQLAWQNAVLADGNRKLAEDNGAARKSAEEARQRAETTLVDMQTSRGLLAGERGNPALAALWFATAAEQATSDPQRRADNRLRARNWLRDAVLPVRALAVGGDPLTLAFHPKGDLVLLRTPGKLFLWDWPRDKLLPWADGTTSVSSACWSPDGESVAVGLPTGQVQVRRVPDGEVLQEVRQPDAVLALAFSADGRYLALAGQEVRVWDTGAKAFLGPAWKHPQPVKAVAFNHKGDRLVTWSGDGLARLFAVGDPQLPAPLFAPFPHTPGRASVPAFIDDDHALVSITGDNQLTCRDAESGKPRAPGVITTKAYALQAVAASPDGNWFAVGGWSRSHVWKSRDPAAAPLTLGHAGRVEDHAFSADGNTLLTAGWDQTACLWSLPEGRLIGCPLAHMGIISLCDLCRETGYLATAQADGLVRVWAPPAKDRAKARLPLPGGRYVRISPDGRFATPGLWHEEPCTYNVFGPKELTVLEAATGKPAGPVVPLPGHLVDSCICSDKRSVAAVSVSGPDGWLSVCDVATGRPLFEPRSLPGRPVSVVARPDASQVAVLCKGGALQVVDWRTGAEQFTVRLEPWAGTEERWHRAEYTSDGASLVALTDGMNNALHVCDANTGRLRYPPIQPVLKDGPCRSFALSADGRLLATAVTGTNAARVWDVATGRPLSKPLLHPGDVYGLFHVSFSPDGRYLLTSHKDGQARLWDWQASALVCPPLKHPDEVFAGWVLPDGRHAVTACRGVSGTLHVWELTTGKPVAAPIPLATAAEENHVVAFASLSPDNQWVYGSVPLLNSLTQISLAELLSEPDMPTEDLVLLGELASARRIALGDEASLNSEQWLERWQRFRRRQPGFGTPRASLTRPAARNAPTPAANTATGQLVNPANPPRSATNFSSSPTGEAMGPWAASKAS
jgi:WD40 repeat protein/predicted Ser/Thr protein kinase